MTISRTPYDEDKTVATDKNKNNTSALWVVRSISEVWATFMSYALKYGEISPGQKNTVPKFVQLHTFFLL